MNWMDAWLFPLGSVLLGGVGLLVLVRGLFGRRFAVRKTRACRKCRYDMTSTEGPRCTECGYVAKHEGEHYAGRRRWLVVGLGVVFLVGAVGVGMTPGVRQDGWLRLLPLELQVRLFHLERNDDTYGELYYQLQRSQNSGFVNGRWPPTTASLIEDERLERLEDVLYTVSVRNVLRRGASRRATSRSLSMINSIVFERLVEDDLLAIADAVSPSSRSLQSVLSRVDVSENPRLGAIRRQAFALADQDMRNALGWALMNHSGGDADGAVIGQWLASPEHNGDPGYEHARSRIQNRWRESMPVDAWQTYAALIRSNGECGNFKTLQDAAERSPAVCSAAVEWALDLPEGDERDRWFEVLCDVRPKYDADLLEIDWSGAREEAEAEEELYKARGVLRLMKALDDGCSAWLIGLARDPWSVHRETAFYELRSMRLGREEAIEFAFGEGWRDESVDLHARMWPLVQLESWYGDAIPVDMDLTVYWAEVLERAAAGKHDGFSQFHRFSRRSQGQSVFAMLAVGERLLLKGEQEPWLPRLAHEVAQSNSEQPSLQGFVSAMRAGQEKWRYNADHSGSLEKRADALADQLEAKFGPWEGDLSHGQP